MSDTLKAMKHEHGQTCPSMSGPCSRRDEPCPCFLILKPFENPRIE
ncbi:hypothetical protein ERO13_D05G364325v2 [Gossypium hirsutum]|uniref:Uncharacterized protein n=1 Tax=Gossypium darwinii TaxID=34276 RepID=A0A5D2CRD2_GOSDA|nr:hypothetical protein ERO13_D05G364325v2 [Gossypium hirsutum]TYG71874.1 hypothetical protein ES288_D05G434100v1 [Gossypium darwinii]